MIEGDTRSRLIARLGSCVLAGATLAAVYTGNSTAHGLAAGAIHRSQSGGSHNVFAISQGKDRLTVRILPNTAGTTNSIVATSSQADPTLQIQAAFSMIGMKMGDPVTCEFHQQPRGTYVCSTLALFMHGGWQIDLAIRSAHGMSHATVLVHV